MLIKVVAVQAEMGRKLTLEEKIHIFKQKPDFVCLPEYYLIDSPVKDFRQAALGGVANLEYLLRLSEELSCCLIAGTMVEACGDELFNTCFIINKGLVIGRYRKRFPVDGELAKGISSGQSNLVVQIDGLKLGIMICGDVFHPEMFRQLESAGVDVIFCPTTSRYREGETINEKNDRDNQYFVGGARAAGAFIIKTCGVGSLLGKPLQGRSLVAAPWGILKRVGCQSEGLRRILAETLDIAEVRDFRTRLSAETATTNADHPVPER